MRLAALPLGLAVALLVVAWVAALAGPQRAGTAQQVCTTRGAPSGQSGATAAACAGGGGDVAEAATAGAEVDAGATASGSAEAPAGLEPDRSVEIADALSASATSGGDEIGDDSARFASADAEGTSATDGAAGADDGRGAADAAPEARSGATAAPTARPAATVTAPTATPVPTRSAGAESMPTTTPAPSATVAPTVRALPAVAAAPTPLPTTRATATPTARTSATSTATSQATPTAVAAAPIGPQPVGQAPGWRLIFEDNFDYLDTLTWEPAWFSTSDFARPVNDREATCYHPKQVSVAGGQLYLTVAEETDPRCLRKDGVTQANYVSGLVNTRESFTFSYGYAEARIYLPSSGGRLHNWPAFWHTGFNWPYTGEVDIAEGLSDGQPCAVHHYSLDGQHLQSKSCVNWAEPGGWHVFAADWRPDGITYYYDGIEVFTTSAGVTGDPHYLVINFAVNETTAAVAPSTMAIDYVRVWQR